MPTWKDISTATLPVMTLIGGIICWLIAALDQIPFGNPQPTVAQNSKEQFFIVGVLCFAFTFVAGFITVISHLISSVRPKSSNSTEGSKEKQAQPESATKQASQLAKELAKELKTEVSWATEALERANLRSAGQHSLFLRRFDRFKTEKEFIAKQFTNLLMERIKYMITVEKKTVYLVIDSGTTLFPFFQKIAEYCLDLSKDSSKPNWTDKLIILTNNFPGVSSLIDNGLINPNDSYPSLAVNCHLLPGTPLPAYSALVGTETLDALQRFRDTAVQRFRDTGEGDPVFISLLTGSWISLRKNEPRCPVPLARGVDQNAFKQKIIDFADENYVIAPLGKIFIGRNAAYINSVLNPAGKNTSNTDFYSELQIDDKKVNKIKLVSTQRSRKNYLLYTHSDRVLRYLEDIDRYDLGPIIKQFPTCSTDLVPHLFFDLDLPADLSVQKQIEFPDQSIQERLILEFVPPETKESLNHAYYENTTARSE